MMFLVDITDAKKLADSVLEAQYDNVGCISSWSSTDGDTKEWTFVDNTNHAVRIVAYDNNTEMYAGGKYYFKVRYWER